MSIGASKPAAASGVNQEACGIPGLGALSEIFFASSSDRYAETIEGQKYIIEACESWRKAIDGRLNASIWLNIAHARISGNIELLFKWQARSNPCEIFAEFILTAFAKPRAFWQMGGFMPRLFRSNIISGDFSICVRC